MNSHSLQYYQNGQSAYRVLYSRKSRILHDITCRHAYGIPYTEFDVLPKLTQKNISGMKLCKECRRRMLVRSGMTGSERQLKEYLDFFEKVGATDRDLQRIVIDRKGCFTLLSDHLLELKVNEDTWQIGINGCGLFLCHNNYHINKEGIRVFENTFHLQNDFGIQTFWNYTRIITTYSFTQHKAIEKKRERKLFCAKLKAELAIVNQFKREERFSLFFRYYLFVDCYDKHGKAKSYRRRFIHILSEEPCGEYVIIRCRIWKRDQKAFDSYMKHLRDKAFCECRADYVEACEQNIPQVG